MKKILIIDDEPDITLCLKKILEENGFAYVDVFNDPIDVLARYDEPDVAYDFAIIDIIMPKLNGFDLYERIRQIDGKVKACFIIAYRVCVEALREIYPGSDADCFITKPIQSEDLLKRVASAIS